MLFYTATVVAGVFVLLLSVERFFALRKPTRALVPRLLLNLLMSGLAFLTAVVIIRPTVAALIQWSGQNRFGLLHIMSLPAAVQFTLGFLLMDLSFYYWHVANHRIPLFWRFHNVHHLDPDLDASTAFRFHFGEVALSAGFRVVQVTAIGVSTWIYVVYELAFQVNTVFHHSNIRLPIKLEQVLNWFIVTPRMHGIHHSQVRDETNSNYSVVFSWWDRLHRSIGLDIPQSDLLIGVPAYSKPEDNRFWNLVLAPFRKQRQYWIGLDGRPVLMTSRSRKQNCHRLAE